MSSLRDLVKQINEIKINVKSLQGPQGIDSLMKKAQLCTQLASVAGDSERYAEVAGAAVVASTKALTFKKRTFAGMTLPHGFRSTAASLGAFFFAVGVTSYISRKDSANMDKDDQRVLQRLVSVGTMTISIVIAMRGAAMMREKIVRDGQKVAKGVLDTYHNVLGPGGP